MYECGIRLVYYIFISGISINKNLYPSSWSIYKYLKLLALKIILIPLRSTTAYFLDIFFVLKKKLPGLHEGNFF
jgi:hypothetical protein